jgi:hypothetical protein
MKCPMGPDGVSLPSPATAKRLASAAVIITLGLRISSLIRLLIHSAKLFCQGEPGLIQAVVVVCFLPST